MKITKNQIISFKKLSKDKNKIHLEENFAKKFFFKKPIVHGIDLALRGIKNFLKLKKKKLIIDKLNIEFKNYTHAGEKFNIKVLKNEIIIFNDLNIKLIIKINYTEYRHFKKIKKKKD